MGCAGPQSAGYGASVYQFDPLRVDCTGAVVPDNCRSNRGHGSPDEPQSDQGRRLCEQRCRENTMIIHRTLAIAIRLAAASTATSLPAMAQACTHNGPEVSCDDGRRGLLSGDAILWPDGTRSSLTPQPSVIIGNKSSVIVGQGVFVGKGNGVVPLDNPSSPNKARCAVLDGVSYCY
jgi:hypothetical protein